MSYYFNPKIREEIEEAIKQELYADELGLPFYLRWGNEDPVRVIRRERNLFERLARSGGYSPCCVVDSIAKGYSELKVDVERAPEEFRETLKSIKDLTGLMEDFVELRARIREADREELDELKRQMSDLLGSIVNQMEATLRAMRRLSPDQRALLREFVKPKSTLDKIKEKLGF